jgi:hypothetical protein
MSDKIKVAKVIADMLGVDDSMTPEKIVSAGMKILKNKKLSPELLNTLKKMLDLASDVGIKVVKESDDNINKYKKLMKKPAHHMDNYDENPITEPGHSLDDEDLEDDQLRRRKVDYHINEDVEDHLDSIDDEDLEDMADDIDSEDDILDVYDEDEISIIDADTGEEEKEEIEEEALMEVLSKMERLRAKFRFMKTKAKRARRLQIVLKKRSDTKTLSKRARKLAIRILKERILKKKLGDMSVTDKERIETIISKRKKIVDRLAMRLLPRIRKIESERLSHKAPQE